jgi:hypothetical protein
LITLFNPICNQFGIVVDQAFGRTLKDSADISSLRIACASFILDDRRNQVHHWPRAEL